MYARPRGSVIDVVATVEAVVTEGDLTAETTVAVTVEAVVTGVEIMAPEIMTIAHPAENTEEATTVGNHEVGLENQVDGGQKVRVALVDAEITRGAFI